MLRACFKDILELRSGNQKSSVSNFSGPLKSKRSRRRKRQSNVNAESHVEACSQNQSTPPGELRSQSEQSRESSVESICVEPVDSGETMTSSDKINEKHIFRGKEFSAWKTRIKILLRSRKLISTSEDLPVDSDNAARTAFAEKESKAMALIIDCLDNQRLVEISECIDGTLKQIMEKLSSIYEDCGAASVNALLSRLESLCYNESKEMNEHIAEFESIVNQLRMALSLIHI